jgi:SAM-dependent methyltransferase
MNARFNSSHEATATCGACLWRGLDHFYQVDNIPTTSNLLMTSRDEAVSWARGSLRLARCPRCGFITNTVFNDATRQLTARYEASQACSPTFGKFARELARNWIDRYQLKGKRILEIGCGRGEFISMMCDMAGAGGWGVDPIVDPSRSTTRVQFLADKFGPHLKGIDADFIVCRHTLEHIPEVHAFLSEVRAAAGDRRDVVVAIEVPDTLRVLNEAAFWDIYYEHCSYFDEDSLATAMTAVGFELISSRLEYAGQYLIVEARPPIGTTCVPPISGNAAAIPEFVQRCGNKIGFWINALRQVSKRTVVWGAGSKAVGFLTTLGVRDEVIAVVDINPAKHGTFLPGSGHEIIAPDRLREIRPDRVIVMNPIYLDEIGRSIAQMGLSAQLIALE